ncbi:hypothetical protein EDB19DRAFT_1904540 [Suillus lakei]|nr:hypothetical protein EDB19DRAFT_1904540 [Suillus lakei]
MNLCRPSLPTPPGMSSMRLGVPQPATHGPLSDQEYGLPSFWDTGAMPEGTDPGLGQLPQELLPYYGDYEPGAQDFLPQYATYSEGQTQPTLHDPWVTRSLPEAADRRLGQLPQEPLPYDTSGFIMYESGTQEFLLQRSTHSEEQSLSALRKLWGSLSEVAYPRLGQYPPEPLLYGTSGSTSYEPGAQQGTYSEGQTLSALRDPCAAESLPEVADPHLGRPPQNLLPYGISGSTSYEPGARDILPQHSIYSEEQTLPDSSYRHDQPLPPPVVQGHQNKVKCTQPRCIAVVNRENLTRHINEVHRRKIKARCDRCGKGFARPYMKKHHILRAKCGIA